MKVPLCSPHRPQSTARTSRACPMSPSLSMDMPSPSLPLPMCLRSATNPANHCEMLYNATQAYQIQIYIFSSPNRTTTAATLALARVAMTSSGFWEMSSSGSTTPSLMLSHSTLVWLNLNNLVKLDGDL